MSLRRLIILTTSTVALAAAPATALADTGGTNRPVSGKSSSTTTVDLATGTGTSDGRGQISHLGAFIFHNDHGSFQITATTFSWQQTATLVAANGDELYATADGNGVFLSPTTNRATLVSTITGGTGRFASASGTITSTIVSETVGMVGSEVTSTDTETHVGRISY